jgi:hypothetical protein
MKTFIAATKTGMIATKAKNKTEAWNKFKVYDNTTIKETISISMVDIQYCPCVKID